MSCSYIRRKTEVSYADKIKAVHGPKPIEIMWRRTAKCLAKLHHW